MKRYWRLILKSREELDYSKQKKITCFSNLTTEKDVVDFILRKDKKLRETYYKYQELLTSIKQKNLEKFIYDINNVNDSVSEYMKTSIKTLKEFQNNIYNTFKTGYHNRFI